MTFRPFALDPQPPKLERRCNQCGKRIPRNAHRRTCRLWGPCDLKKETRIRVEVCVKCKKECGTWV